MFFELIGEQRRSGTIVVAAEKHQFKPGRADVFVFTALPYVGRLVQLRVGTDGAGLFSAWSLRLASRLFC